VFRIFHKNIVHLIIIQQLELLEIQKVQIDMMNDILMKIEIKNLYNCIYENEKPIYDCSFNMLP
jgi:hypothetical protein